MPGLAQASGREAGRGHHDSNARCDVMRRPTAAPPRDGVGGAGTEATGDERYGDAGYQAQSAQGDHDDGDTTHSLHDPGVNLQLDLQTLGSTHADKPGRALRLVPEQVDDSLHALLGVADAGGHGAVSTAWFAFAVQIASPLSGGRDRWSDVHCPMVSGILADACEQAVAAPEAA